MAERKLVNNRSDSTGQTIKLNDVLRNEENGEMALVIQAGNNSGVKGLAVVNEIIGLKDWMDVFPDGLWTIVGNASISAEY